VGDIYWNELNAMIQNTFSNLNADFSHLEDKTELSRIIKQYCEQSLKISEEIGSNITNLHNALILPEQEEYSLETIESDYYLKNYTHKLNLMISDLQHLMQQESKNFFYNLTKIQAVFLDVKDILEKFRSDFKEEDIEIQPVHQDLHMEQILYNKKDTRFNFYFMDFEGDPELSVEEKKQKFPTDKDIASYLRSLSYIKFNTLLLFIEKNVIEKDEYIVPEEILYSLFFRKGFREKRKGLDAILKFLNKWERKVMNKILKNLDANITLINYFTIERILHEVMYEILFRPKKFLVPLLGLKEVIENN
jgi:maltose alpha-D-glucosyltransferase/alpha-amylase